MKHSILWITLTGSVICIQLAGIGFVLSGQRIYLLALALGCLCLASSICQLIAHHGMRESEPPEKHYHFYIHANTDVSSPPSSSPWMRRW